MSNLNFFKDLYYTSRGILLYETMLKTSCYWDREKMNAYQFKKLKKLLKESVNVKYYRDLFFNISFNPITDFNQLSDLQKLPILDKNYVKINSNDFVNQKYVSNSILFKTSGSTGVPYEILVHPNQWIMEQGVVWRHWKWGGYNFRDSLAMVRSFVPKSGESLWKTNVINNFTYYSPFHLSEDNIKLYLKSMIEKQVTVLRGYPSSIATIADYVVKYNPEIPKIKLILTASEVLNHLDRLKIEKAFNAKVSNHYGLAEQIVMMGDCEKHEGLHNYDEYGYLELINTGNKNVKRIIGTNLHNLTTPLIRYDTGDLAIVSDKSCSCGMCLPIIENVIGRSDAQILTSTGFKVPSVNFYTLLEHYNEIDRWQIVQHSITEVEVIIKSSFISEERISNIVCEFQKRLNADMNVRINLNGTFLQKNEGKINPFISKIL